MGDDGDGDEWCADSVAVSPELVVRAEREAAGGLEVSAECVAGAIATQEAAPDEPASFSLEAWLDPAMTRRLVAYARRFVDDRGEAEDVAQETLLRAREHIGTLRSPAKAEAWLFRICRHAAIDHTRARRVRRTVWAPMPAEGSSRRAPPVIVPDDDEALPLPEGPLDLRALPAHQRLLVSLHYERGLSHPTLCRMTGLLPSALRVRLFRARGTLLSACRG